MIKLSNARAVESAPGHSGNLAMCYDCFDKYRSISVMISHVFKLKLSSAGND